MDKYRYYEGEDILVRHQGPFRGDMPPHGGFQILRSDGTWDPWAPGSSQSYLALSACTPGEFQTLADKFCGKAVALA